MKPKRVKISALDFNIEYVPLNEQLFGDFSYLNSRIRIEKNLSGPPLVDTILHEMNHAVWRVWQLKDRKEDEERVVAVMAGAWTQIFRDNPEFSKWMQKELEQ
jgi:hypothetical protein